MSEANDHRCHVHPDADRMYSFTATGKRYMCATCRRDLGEEIAVRIDAAELAQLRADAGRYRWLKNRITFEQRHGRWRAEIRGWINWASCDGSTGTLDAAIDAAVDHLPSDQPTKGE